MDYSNRLIRQEKARSFLAHAINANTIACSYLFSGLEGIGKKTLARDFAASLLCEEGKVFSGCSCSSCHKISSEHHPDCKWVGKDETLRSIKIDDIRELQSWIMLRPLEAKRKVCVIVGAERMTEEAANAFLKTLEEPPEHTYILLLAEQAFFLKETIISRVVEVRLEPVPVTVLEKILQEKYGMGKEARFIAYHAGGSIGKALSYDAKDYLRFKNEIIDAFVGSDPGHYFLSLVTMKQDALTMHLQVILSFLHDVLLVKHHVREELIQHDDKIRELKLYARRCTVDVLVERINLCEKTWRDMKRNANVKLLMARLAAHSEMTV